MVALPEAGLSMSGRSAQFACAGARGSTLAFEYGLFALAIVGMTLGGAAVALGYLRSPAASMVVGDWYLLTSGFVIVAAASSRPGLIGVAAAATFLFVAALFPVARAAGLDEGLKSHIKIAVACASAAAIAAQFAFAARQGRNWRENRDLAVGCFAVALVVVPLMSGWGIEISALIHNTLDARALRIDETFGVRVPAELMEAVMSSPAASYLVFHVYISVSLAMVGYDLIFGDTRAWRMTKLLLISSALGFAAYFVTPVVGTNFFDRYDVDEPLQVLLQFPGSAGHGLPRNAMPSLHTTWGLFFIVLAIMRFGRSRRESVVGALFGAYGALTICGALVFGRHYLVDCIVALPFATTIFLAAGGFALKKPGGASDPLLVCGAALVCCWIAVLRFGYPLDAWPVVYALTAANLVHFVLSVARLRRAANEEDGARRPLDRRTHIDDPA